MADEITTGSTVTFRLEATLDDEVWDITGDTVTLYLIDPAGNSANYTATLTDAANGIATYTVATTVLDEVGTWQRQWKVVDGSTTAWSVRKSFYVTQGG